MVIPGRFLLVLAVFLSGLTGHTQVFLAESSQSDYRIIIPSGADSLEIKAAAELQHYFEAVTGAKLPVLYDSEQPAPHEIILGNSRRLELNRVKTGFSENENAGNPLFCFYRGLYSQS